MAKKVKSKFQIIAAPASEFMKAGFGGGSTTNLGVIESGIFAGFSQLFVEPGGIIVCDYCNHQMETEETCYYIAVLNCIYCERCFMRWIKTAAFYEEDIPYEERNYKITEEKLRSAGIEVVDLIELPVPEMAEEYD